MSDLPTLAALIFLMFCSAFFSASETAFSSLNRTKLKALAMGGSKKAQRTLELSDDYDKILSGVLIGNNIVNILSTSIATVLFVGWFGNLGVTLSTVVMTVVILIFGEISPKSIAKENAETFALAITPALTFALKLLTPLTTLFNGWRVLLGKVFKFDANKSITEDELIILVDEAENDKVIDSNEGSIIRNAIEFNDLDAEDILTHRMDIASIEDVATPDEIEATFGETGFSRLPVYHETIDNVLGVIYEKDYYRAKKGQAFDLKSILKQPLFIAKSTKISALLSKIQQTNTHMAIVVDEFGGTAGLITLEDILEELVGEIWDEHDDVIEGIKQTGEDTFIVNCSEALDDLFEHFDLSVDDYDAVTVGGWVMQELGKIADVGDRFTFQNLEVEVTAVDHRRPVECFVRLLPKPEESDE